MIHCYFDIEIYFGIHTFWDTYCNFLSFSPVKFRRTHTSAALTHISRQGAVSNIHVIEKSDDFITSDCKEEENFLHTWRGRPLLLTLYSSVVFRSNVTTVSVPTYD